ncbi:MAG: AAA family ATPase [bacterium]|nr:AAA family ATPase [bacterium]
MKKRLNFILLNGAIGSGKSTIADILEDKLKRTAVLEIEDIRRLVSDSRKGTYDNALAWKIIYRMCDEYFNNGVSVLLKQTVASQDLSNTFLDLARKCKCTIGFYHLRAPRDELLKRMKNRQKVRNASETLIKSNIRKHENINYTDAAVIDTSRLKPSEAAQFILDDLEIQ